MIAAAPEMYDALRQAYAELRRMYEIVSKRKLINEGLDTGCKATIEKMERAFKKAELIIKHCSNPDLYQHKLKGGYWSEMTRPNNVKHERVTTFAQASKICRKFIEKYDLGGGNWIDGEIYRNKKKVATVSYNGRVWDLNEKEIVIEEVDAD